MGIRIAGRVEELVELRRIDPAHRLGPVDQAFGDHVDGDLDGGLGGALAGARLQHPETPLLDGELHVLGVAEVLFQPRAHVEELAVHHRHDFLHGRQVRLAAGFLSGDAQGLRRADTGDHVFALGIDEELAVEGVLAARRVAREAHAGRRIVSHVAEHHGLHGDGRAPFLGDVVELAVGDGALVLPTGEDGTDGTPQLLPRVLREGLVEDLPDLVHVQADDGLPVAGTQVGIEEMALGQLVVLEDVLEVEVLHAHDHVGIHLDEAPVAVVGEAPVAAVGGQALDRLVVEAEVQHGIHHAGHGRPGTRTHRHKERVAAISQFGAHVLLDTGQRLLDAGLEAARVGALVGTEPGADLGGDGEAGRHRQAQLAHLGQVRPLAAEKGAHAGISFGGPTAEGVNPLGHGRSLSLSPTLRSSQNPPPHPGPSGCATTASTCWPASRVRYSLP